MSKVETGDVFKALSNKTVLITGGTGTFGKACIKYLRDVDYDIKIRVLSRDEFKQAQLREVYGSDNISYMLGDIRDIERLRLAFAGVDIVIHAAALKHVELGEYNPRQFIDTNILGTENVCRAAIDCAVRQVITLASDKGVNPINLYGATKMVAEKSTIQHNSYSPAVGQWPGTYFKVVRYGNVAGSRGSAIGLFQRCRDRGEPIPITDRGMTRFWMLIREAVELVMYAIIDTTRGGTYIPHLYAFDIMDLADAISTVNGYRDVGIRPGEKLHEMLMTDHEAQRALYDSFKDFGDHSGVYVLPPAIHDWNHSHTAEGLVPASNVLNNPYCSDGWNWRMSKTDLMRKIAYHIQDAE